MLEKTALQLYELSGINIRFSAFSFFCALVSLSGCLSSPGHPAQKTFIS